jgi:hypothetical protein
VSSGIWLGCPQVGRCVRGLGGDIDPMALAARHGCGAGLARQAGTPERLACDAAEVLGTRHPARRPVLQVDQAADNDDQAADP